MLEHIFGSKTRLKLLNIFFRNPEHSFYVRELARLSATQLNAVRREISNLEKIGIVRHVEEAVAKHNEVGTERSKYFQLAQESLLVPELKSLLIKGRLLEEQELISDLKERAGIVKLLILTGFFTNDSSVETDILLVGKIKPMVIAKIMHDYESENQRSIRYTIMNEQEFSERYEIGDKFLYSIFESKHITAVDELPAR